MVLERWRATATLLAGHRDVLDARPSGGDVPATLIARNWAPYLLALDDAALDALEIGGVAAVWPPGAPTSLLELSTSVRAFCTLPALTDAGEPRPSRRGESPRKQEQIDAFARIAVPLAKRAKRVVDVGSGHGHLTRDLADRLGVPVLGLERDAALAEKARAYAKDGGAHFAITDVLSDGLALESGDCVVGLHACGELGDAMVVSADRAGASLALVGCCLQKRRTAARAPLSELPDVEAEALTLPKSILGLSNLTARDDGVEASRSENLRARERRLALHRLLCEAGPDVPLGAEIAGLNRRAAHAELDVLVARAFAIRQRPSPSPHAIDAAARWASVHHTRMRRLALPRSLLARLLEVWVLLDRALYLEARGCDVRVGVVFPTTGSARNLGLVASSR